MSYLLLVHPYQGAWAKEEDGDLWKSKRRKWLPLPPPPLTSLRDPGAVAGAAMAGTYSLGLLLLLLLRVMVTVSLPVIVVRLNKAALDYVSDIGKAPLQRALQVTLSDFMDPSGEVLQSTRVQILDVHVPFFYLKFIAGFGVHLSAAANFTIKVFRVPEPMELVLPADLLADVHVARDSIGTLVLSVPTCSSIFSPASMLDGRNSTSLELLELVQEHIKADLNNKLCLHISALVQDLNVHLGTLIGTRHTPAMPAAISGHVRPTFASFPGRRLRPERTLTAQASVLCFHESRLEALHEGLSPVGPESQLRYSTTSMPTITSNYISLDIRATLFLLGKPILLPLHGAHPFVLPWPSGDEGAMVTVGLSRHLFDCALLMLQKAGSLNLDITGQLNSKNNLLNTSVLGQLIPEVAHLFPAPTPVVLKVQLGATPVVMLHTSNSTLQLQPFVEVFAAPPNLALQFLFSLDVIVNLDLQLSVSKAKLRGSTSMLGGFQLSVATSNVGSVDAAPSTPTQPLAVLQVDQVHALISTVFQKPLLDHLNALLGMGIVLPSVLNLHYVHSEVSVREGYVVVSSGLAYQR
ncbi:BPI fold-containing family B member 2 [Apodemus speciosus]|uniref:BPI fold-containing family B member 2 n=1 Tax=Apodemus speciosus TaxID=105296 RepID=A0ABQ0EJS4_APOSI